MLTEIQHDAIKELINQGIGRAANLLNTMLHSHIILRVPELMIIERSRLPEFVGLNAESLATVSLSFKGPIIGNAKMVFPTESATKLVSAFIEETPQDDDLDSIRMGTLLEVGNVVLNTLVGVLSNALGIHLQFVVPNYDESGVEQLLNSTIQFDNDVLYAKTSFFIHNLNIQGDFMLFFELGGFTNLIQYLDQYISHCLNS